MQDVDTTATQLVKGLKESDELRILIEADFLWLFPFTHQIDCFTKSTVYEDMYHGYEVRKRRISMKAQVGLLCV